MVATKTLPFQSYADATHGQITWVFANQQLDFQEERKKVHPHCLDKWTTDRCPVCHEPSYDEFEITDEIENEIYRPGDEIRRDLTEEEKSERRKELEEILRN